MTLSQRLSAVAAALVVGTLAQPASAAVTGTFIGLASGIFYEGSTEFVDEPASGSFSFDMTQPPPECECDYGAGSMQVTVRFMGAEYRYGIGDGRAFPTVQVSQTATQQTLDIATGSEAYSESWMHLVGPLGSLFDGLDPRSLHPGRIDFGQSVLGVYVNRTLGADIVFTQFAFDGFPVQTIPEPGAWSMLGVGLLALARARRRAVTPVGC